MPILLVRHGDALASHGIDEERVLSIRGRDECRVLGKAMIGHGLSADRIVASPLVRAVQTSELLAAAIAYLGTIEVDDAFVPGGDLDRALALLTAASAKGLVVAVTHEPIVRAIAAGLLAQPTFPAFRTAGAVLIDAGRVTLRLDRSAP